MSHVKARDPSGGLPIVIVGLHSSGKSTLARAIASAINAKIFELGAGVRQVARESGRNCLVEVAYELMQANPLHMPIAAIERAGSEREESIFVGPRTVAEFDYLISALNDPLTIGLSATSEYRYKRWCHRHLNIADTWEQREWHEASWETAKLVDRCDLVINANQSIGRKTSTVLARIRGTAA